MYICLAKEFDIRHWVVFGADGRKYGHVVSEISRLVRLPNILRCGAPLSLACARERFAITITLAFK